jgi:hypothetical protein
MRRVQSSATDPARCPLPFTASAGGRSAAGSSWRQGR